MEKAADEAVKVFGKVHVLVNNAGIAHPTSLSRTTYDDWDWTMAVNVDGVFNGARAFLPAHSGTGEGGQIITTSSIRDCTPLVAVWLPTQFLGSPLSV